MVKKELSQEKEHKILCLEKSLTISKQECVQWEGRAVRWKERVAQLEKENQVLKEKLGTNSRNSSKPPSQRFGQTTILSIATGKQHSLHPILAPLWSVVGQFKIQEG